MCVVRVGRLGVLMRSTWRNGWSTPSGPSPIQMDQKGLWSPRQAVWCVAGSTAKDSVRSLMNNFDHGQGLLERPSISTHLQKSGAQLTLSTQSTEDSDPVSRDRNFQPDGH
uniref:Uncharacterized protein n=1 Tax=Noctiluca scintillans TaxID=2966 RepID=A0A7S1EWX3_NOCSC|mmetsp:Transcript_14044/g.38258  ORF Transcript_14044/g.38258 Transcript_14044/m.38258 type:complete len:111 (+) Transcript_14044:102-434(+)